MSRRELVATWYAVAKIRERDGDKKGADRARRTARMMKTIRTNRVGQW